MNEYFNHITIATPGMLSSLFIWKEWISDSREAKKAQELIDDAISALSSLNDLLIENEHSMIYGDEYDSNNGRK